MIWNTPPNELIVTEERFKAAPHMLIRTDLIHKDLAELDIPTDPINYFEIPQRVHKIGKLVVAYGHMLPTGALDPTLPAIYGVTSNPNAFTNRASQKRSQETHVFAEHLSLTRGIFTPYARVNSESNAAKLIPAAYAEDYTDDRMAHLQALVQEVSDSRELTKKQRHVVTKEIGLAIDMFGNTD